MIYVVKEIEEVARFYEKEQAVLADGHKKGEYFAYSGEIPEGQGRILTDGISKLWREPLPPPQPQPTSEQFREKAYSSGIEGDDLSLVFWKEKLNTVNVANNLWSAYNAEAGGIIDGDLRQAEQDIMQERITKGKVKSSQLAGLILRAKAHIETLYPNEEIAIPEIPNQDILS